MKHAIKCGGNTWIIILAILVLALAVCCRTYFSPSPGSPTCFETRRIPDALSCQAHTTDAASWQSWPRSTAPSGVIRNGLVSDGDRLWVATSRGLLRLDVRTWECDLFTSAIGQSLAGAYPVFPDGVGGLWVGVTGRVIHFSGQEWQLAYEIPDGYPERISALGLGQAGNLCIQLYSESLRGCYTFQHACLVGNTLPLDNTPFIVSYCTDAAEDCYLWQQVSGQQYNYTTPAACMRIRRITSTYFDPVAASANGDEAWMVKHVYGKRDRLFHWSGETTEWDWSPYQHIAALTVDPVYGGAWMATEDGLVHVCSEAVAESNDVPSPSVSPVSYISPLASLSPLPTPSSIDNAVHTRFTFHSIPFGIEAFPGAARSLAVDRAGQVWVIGGDRVLRYDEALQGWHAIISLPHGVDAIAADPDRGIWAAGLGELVYFDGERRYTWSTSDDYRDKPTALMVEENGRVWMGVLKHGVWTTFPRVQSTTGVGRKYTTLNWRRFTAADGLASELITALALGPDGRIYAAHHAGVSVFDPAAGVENGHWVTLPGSDMGDQWANAIAFDPPARSKSGRVQTGVGLWVGYHHPMALRRYRDGLWTNYSLRDDESVSVWVWGIGSLLVDDEGTLWIGTTGGLWRLPTVGDGSKSHWQMLTPDGLAVRDVLDIAQDDRGRIWVGGKEGVAVWKGDR